MAKRVTTIVKKEDRKVPEFKWYSLRVISGKEKSVRDRIETEVRINGWSDIITQIVVPTEKKVMIRNGKKMPLEKNILPGYIIIEANNMKIKGDIAHYISQVPNVIYFLGKDNPLAMTQAEANRLLGIVDENMTTRETILDPFTIGEQVRVTDGPFNDFIGEINSIDDMRKKVKVTVRIFGRPTEVELSYLQIERSN
jgi:transcription termination/antitermination protein NusG